MGQAQGTSRRDRTESGSVGGYSRHRQYGGMPDDECPVQLKIAKAGPPGGLSGSSQPSLQYEDSNEYPVVIKWSGGVAKSVHVSGSWNHWRTKIPLVKSQEDFSTIVNLPEGRHEFKFMVDGDWKCDNNLSKTDNQLGTENNVIVINQDDFEVFDALDRDLEASVAAGGTDSLPDKGSGGLLMAQSISFTQDIPDRKTFDNSGAPPSLPPQLLQVILNKDTPQSCDPNVLPEPHHVMLNHLYALSIKDGVMVLSATHRYRKKYVTTLLYKPIST